MSDKTDSKPAKKEQTTKVTIRQSGTYDYQHGVDAIFAKDKDVRPSERKKHPPREYFEESKVLKVSRPVATDEDGNPIFDVEKDSEITDVPEAKIEDLLSLLNKKSS